MTTIAMPALTKLPVWQTVGACYATVARNLGQLVRISWLWLLVMIPLYAAAHWLGSAAQEDDASSLGAAALVMIVELPFLASIAVAWHRLILSAERVTAPAYLRLDGIVWHYVLYSLLLTLLAMLFTAVAVLVVSPAILIVEQSSIAAVLTPDPDVSFDPTLWYMALMVLLLVLLLALSLLPLFVLPRLMLVLPAMAVGERLSLREAWRLTRANTLRLGLATLLCILPVVVPVLSLYFWWDWDWSAATVTRGAYVIGELINSLVVAVLTTFAVTLLSLTYRFFAGQRSEGVPPPATP